MESWEKIHEDNLIPNDLVLKKLIQDKIGLKLSLADYYEENRLVDILFRNGAVAYRCIDEGEYLSTFSYLNNKYGSKFLGSCNMFKVKNSKFMKWLNEESLGFFDRKSRGCEQYVIFTVSEVIEVIAYNEPEIISYNKPEKVLCYA